MMFRVSLCSVQWKIKWNLLSFTHIQPMTKINWTPEKTFSYWTVLKDVLQKPHHLSSWTRAGHASTSSYLFVSWFSVFTVFSCPEFKNREAGTCDHWLKMREFPSSLNASRGYFWFCVLQMFVDQLISDDKQQLLTQINLNSN